MCIRTDAPSQVVEVEGLVEDGDRSQRGSVGMRLGISECGHQDEWRPMALAPQSADDRQTVHHWHSQIGDYQDVSTLFSFIVNQQRAQVIMQIRPISQLQDPMTVPTKHGRKHGS
jgi:hypothetical protein